MRVSAAGLALKNMKKTKHRLWLQAYLPPFPTPTTHHPTPPGLFRAAAALRDPIRPPNQHQLHPVFHFSLVL